MAEITRAVEARLGEPVAPSSVRSYLRIADDLLTRTARGRYRLRPAEASVVAEEPAAPGANGSRPGPAVVHGDAMLFQDDCIAWLGRQAPDSLHAVVTDPPYGLVEYSDAEQTKLRAGRGGVWRIPPSFDGHKRSPVPRFTVLSERDLARLEAFFTEWGRALYPVLAPRPNVLA
ncbi:MAG: site-specific DNA-methyltransferase, partial [Chloroflexota bacterium]|nr:site-specific DNA-methyltransferase [Chloroflexota bacterium]